MIKNYFKIAWRNLVRNKTFSAINILGLALGLACSLLILLWVQHEISYDRFHEHKNEIYRVIANDRGQRYPLCGAPLAAAMKAEMPNVLSTLRLKLTPGSTSFFDTGNQRFEEKRILYADSTFFQFFSFPLIAGNAATALNQPDGVLLTEQIAKKYFGTAMAVGKTLRMNNSENFIVTGVMKEVPTNSHLQFDILLPMSYWARHDSSMIKGEWQSLGFYTYVLLNKHAERTAGNLSKLDSQINLIYRKAAPDFLASFSLQPLTEVHLHSSDLLLDVEAHGNIQNIWIFSAIAIFILLVACINFMNLTTARSTQRAKEVGLRKVVGAQRIQLIGQFMGESMIITFLSLLLGIGLVAFALPVFNELLGKTVTIHYTDGWLFTSLLLVFILTSVISGSYPAFYLSGFQAVKVLKNSITKPGSGNLFFRNGLVVFQFVISIVLIVGTTVIYSQLRFIQNKNLGYDKENLMYIPLTGDLSHNVAALRAELSNDPHIVNSSFVSELPVNLLSGTVGVIWDGKSPDTWPMFSTIGVDENFLNVFQTQLLAGRWFSSAFGADTLNYIINEKSLHLMGFKAAEAIGKSLSVWGNKGTIIGVVKDFNFKPVQQSIEPLVMLGRNTKIGYLVAKSKPGNTAEAITELERIWKKFNPYYEFEYGFLDQDLTRRYVSEKRMGILFNISAILAILISCLGLAGLALFTARRRVKEIGIRKTLGASVTRIVFMLSKDFLRLVLLAIIIALPIAYYFMHRWLQDFAYRIEIHWWMFTMAGFAAVLIAIITVSFQAIKAAIANPVNSLRAE